MRRSLSITIVSALACAHAQPENSLPEPPQAKPDSENANAGLPSEQSGSDSDAHDTPPAPEDAHDSNQATSVSGKKTPHAEPVPNEARDRSPDPGFSSEERARIKAVQAQVQAAAHAYDLDPQLLNALIWIESRFRPRAKGPAGARGLLQLMPRTGKSVASRLHRRYRPYDPDFSIHAGAYYLGRMLQRFDGETSLALAAYNRGVGRVAGWVERGEPIQERTQAYIDRVLAARERFMSLATLEADLVSRPPPDPLP